MRLVQLKPPALTQKPCSLRVNDALAVNSHHLANALPPIPTSAPQEVLYPLRTTHVTSPRHRPPRLIAETDLRKMVNASHTHSLLTTHDFHAPPTHLYPPLLLFSADAPRCSDSKPSSKPHAYSGLGSPGSDRPSLGGSHNSPYPTRTVL